VHQSADAMPGIDRHPADWVDRKTGRIASALQHGSEDLDRFADVPEHPTTALPQLDAFHIARADLVAPVSRVSPPDASAETRAAMLTVAPNQSPSRSTAEPVCMPALTAANP
jgi:hypothetical protein